MTIMIEPSAPVPMDFDRSRIAASGTSMTIRELRASDFAH
jgi:hypothetical protein